jgi:hypothetical protein
MTRGVAIMRDLVGTRAQKRPAPVRWSRSLCEPIYHPNVFGARTLRALAESELDVIALIHSSTVERGLVEEDVCATVVLLDEAEPLQVIEAIDGAGHQRKR